METPCQCFDKKECLEFGCQKPKQTMETVKPLTWEEAQELWKDAVYWIDGAEYNVDEKKLLDVINTHASSRVREVEEELERVKSENKLASDLKEYLISTYEKFGDKKALVTKGYRAYTGLDLANEIRNNTPEGIESLQSIIALTIDLLRRDKINLNGPTYQELKEENKRLQERLEAAEKTIREWRPN